MIGMRIGSCSSPVGRLTTATTPAETLHPRAHEAQSVAPHPLPQHPGAKSHRSRAHLVSRKDPGEDRAGVALPEYPEERLMELAADAAQFAVPQGQLG